MKNIIEIWGQNGQKVPFCVSKCNWSDDSIYVVVEKVEPDGKGYGKAYGTPMTNGKINTYFNYNKKWRLERLIPNPGVYNWKFRPDKEAIIIDEKSGTNSESSTDNEKYQSKNKILKLSESIDFGKHKGKSINYIVENNRNYLLWALKNVDGFKVSEEVMKLINNMD